MSMKQQMDEVTKKVLVTIHDFLSRLTKAENLTPEQLTEAFMATTAVRYQIARMDYPFKDLAEVAAAETELAETLAGSPSSSKRATGPAYPKCSRRSARCWSPITRRWTRSSARVRAVPIPAAAATRAARVMRAEMGLFTAERLEEWPRRSGNAAPKAR
jgi:hypothetical protein